MRRKDVVSGLLLITVGLIFLAGNLEVVPDANIARLWPLILIALGGARVLVPGTGSRVDGLPLLLVGSIFLAHNYRVIHLQDSWPLFIVAAGVSILVSAMTREGRRGPQGGQSS